MSFLSDMMKEDWSTDFADMLDAAVLTTSTATYDIEVLPSTYAQTLFEEEGRKTTAVERKNFRFQKPDGYILALEHDTITWNGKEWLIVESIDGDCGNVIKVAGEIGSVHTLGKKKVTK